MTEESRIVLTRMVKCLKKMQSKLQKMIEEENSASFSSSNSQEIEMHLDNCAILDEAETFIESTVSTLCELRGILPEEQEEDDDQ